MSLLSNKRKPRSVFFAPVKDDDSEEEDTDTCERDGDQESKPRQKDFQWRASTPWRPADIQPQTSSCSDSDTALPVFGRSRPVEKERRTMRENTDNSHVRQKPRKKMVKVTLPRINDRDTDEDITAGKANVEPKENTLQWRASTPWHSTSDASHATASPDPYTNKKENLDIETSHSRVEISTILKRPKAAKHRLSILKSKKVEEMDMDTVIPRIDDRDTDEDTRAGKANVEPKENTFQWRASTPWHSTSEASHATASQDPYTNKKENLDLETSHSRVERSTLLKRPTTAKHRLSILKSKNVEERDMDTAIPMVETSEKPKKKKTKKIKKLKQPVETHSNQDLGTTSGNGSDEDYSRVMIDMNGTMLKRPQTPTFQVIGCRVGTPLDLKSASTTSASPSPVHRRRKTKPHLQERHGDVSTTDAIKFPLLPTPPSGAPSTQARKLMKNKTRKLKYKRQQTPDLQEEEDEDDDVKDLFPDTTPSPEDRLAQYKAMKKKLYSIN